MSKNKDSEKFHCELCQRAEERLEKAHADISRMTPEEIQKLAFEFQVYRVKLEMQNEELRKTQLQLQVSRDRYHKLYDYAPVGFITLNKKGYITDANQAACLLLGCSKVQLQGTKQVNYIHTEDLERFDLFFKQQKKFSNQQHRIEVRIKQANKQFIPVLCQGSCNHITDYDSEEAFFLTLQEMSEQKRAAHKISQLNAQLEQKVCAQSTELLRKNKKLLENINEIKSSKDLLVEREAKLNSVFNAAVEGIVTIDEAGVIESINRAVTKIFGYQADELVGHNVGKLMPMPHKAQHNNYLKNYLLSHETMNIGAIRQLEGRRKDGTLLPIDLSLSEYKIGEKVYFTGMIRDISERKRKELLDKKHLNELAHVTRMGLMGEMAAGIAHEVNQPLTAIATYSQVCLRMLECDKLDLIKLQETIQKTEKQALRAGQVISRMRTFISSNTIHRSSVDINNLVQDALGLAVDDFRQFSIQYGLDLAGSLPCILVDGVQIEQVILNLIKNSIDAVSKLPKNAQPRIGIQTYFVKNREIEVRVKDNGLGISNEEKAQIFTPFFTTKVSGMGMGLSICQSLIAAHGGVLRFNSSIGKGSTFYFTLPMSG
ncbi:MAG: PAS domain S-box protein [Methyloprofundus sp.]|nr:PAS domain S-box protein [Methyloprofundus sp.]